MIAVIRGYTADAGWHDLSLQTRRAGADSRVRFKEPPFEAPAIEDDRLTIRSTESMAAFGQLVVEGSEQRPRALADALRQAWIPKAEARRVGIFVELAIVGHRRSQLFSFWAVTAQQLVDL